MMTEKRFAIDKSNIIPNGYVIFDEKGEYTFTSQMYRKSLISTCKALNKLNDKNKQLKKDNLNLQEDLDYFKAKNGSLETGMFNLERENEQLKSKLFDCNLELEHSKESVDDAYWELTEIKKENEELKSRIKELEIINEAQSDAIEGLQETMCHLDLSELNGDVE